MTAVDRSPTRLASLLAVVLAAGAVVITGLYSWLSLGAGGAGLFVFVVGVVLGRQAPVTIGAVGIFVGVLLTGIAGGPELALVIGAAATILAWDSASTAIELGQQLGREAPTRRVELSHVTVSGLVGGAGVGIAYGLYTVTAGEASFTAVLFVALAAVLLASALR